MCLFMKFKGGKGGGEREREREREKVENNVEHKKMGQKIFIQY